MSKTVGFHHGALCDPYEKQANDQGYTLGNDEERLEKLGFSLTYAWIQGCLTDAQYDSGLKRFQKQLVKALKPMPDPAKEANGDN